MSDVDTIPDNISPSILERLREEQQAGAARLAEIAKEQAFVASLPPSTETDDPGKPSVTQAELIRQETSSQDEDPSQPSLPLGPAPAPVAPAPAPVEPKSKTKAKQAEPAPVEPAPVAPVEPAPAPVEPVAPEPVDPLTDDLSKLLG